MDYSYELNTIIILLTLIGIALSRHVFDNRKICLLYMVFLINPTIKFLIQPSIEILSLVLNGLGLI